jgi:cytochrome P450
MGEKRQNDWNPLDSSVLKDQRQAYDEMRQRCPAAYSDFMGWSLFRHADIATVLADPETYSNQSPFPAIPNGMDPPAHGEYRKSLQPNFDQKQMSRLEPEVRQIAAQFFEPLLSGAEVDFIDGFATPFSFATLCAQLGWSQEQWKFLSGWAQDSQEAALDRDTIVGKALADKFSEHVKANLDKRRASSLKASDATDALMNTDVDGIRIDDDQIVSILRNWTAGHGTVVASLGILVLHLAQDTELQDRLRSDLSLVPAAVEEILRADGPLVANPRTTKREVRIHGRSIPKGERLTLMWIAANRDPVAFDEPDVVHIARDTTDGLVWGKGIHLCQGAPLAKLEMRVALEELLSRTQCFELTGENLPRRAAYPSNGLAALLLRFN